MNITAKSDSGSVVSLVTVQIGRTIYWVRPTFWYDPEDFQGAQENVREEQNRYTTDPSKAQRWADELARAIP